MNAEVEEWKKVCEEYLRIIADMEESIDALKRDLQNERNKIILSGKETNHE